METSHLLPLDATLQHLFEAGDPDAATKLPERENLAAIHRLFDAVVTGQYDVLIQELSEDVQVELFAPPEFPFVRRAAGREATRAMITHNFNTVVDQRPEILSLTAQGDSLVLVARESGRIRQSDLPYDVHFVYNFQLDGGKVAHIRQFATHSSWVNGKDPEPLTREATV